MRRFGIRGQRLLGVSVATVRELAKPLGKNHGLALQLWSSRIHEARILASIVADPAKLTRSRADAWVRDFDSWDVCDQTCLNLLDKTAYAFTAALQWSRRPEEFVRRAGFALMAALAFHHKTASDVKFLPFLRAILQRSTDQRPFVRKAVNWALRQIGKRNRRLNHLAVHAAAMLKHSPAATARWIGSDAYRELTSSAIRRRLA